MPAFEENVNRHTLYTIRGIRLDTYRLNGRHVWFTGMRFNYVHEGPFVEVKTADTKETFKVRAYLLMEND